MDKKNRAKSTRKLSKEWITNFIHHSNGIEGIVTSKDSILVALCSKDAHVHPYIKNHIKCIEWILENYQEAPGHGSLCYLHGMLLANIDRFAGVYRNVPVRVGDHYPPSSEKLRHYLRYWFLLWDWKPYKSWTHKKTALLRHYEFEWIHPFTDGNGRIGRLLMLWDCLYHRTKMDIIESSQEARLKYYGALAEYQENGRKSILVGSKHQALS